MDTVLVTGSAGKVGRAVGAAVDEAGYMVRPLDIAYGTDLRDEQAVLDAAKGCHAIVHAGALAHDWAGSPAEIMATNVLGTWHVLLAAEQERVSRVVYFSSAQVFGFTDGESEPAYWPVDDDHPLRAARPYGLSKRLAEQMREAWTSRTGITTVVLRPVMILDDGDPRLVTRQNVELGAYVHLKDVVTATTRALVVDLPPHVRLTLCGPGFYDTVHTESVLGWRAERGWPGDDDAAT